MRRLFFVCACISTLFIGRAPLLAQRTPENTKVVYSTNGALITQTISDPAIQFVTFEVIVAARYKDPGHLSQPAEVTLKAPIGTTATLQLEKVFPTGVGGTPYPITFSDGGTVLGIEEVDPLEAYARYLSRIFPGITVEDLRRMYSPEELADRVENFRNFNQNDIAADGIKAIAILQKDTCAPTLKTYRARLIVDLRGVSPTERAAPIRVAGGIKTLEPESARAALVKIGEPGDGKLKGKRLALLASKAPQDSTIRFTQYSGARRIRSLKARRPGIYTHRSHGTMLKVGLPVIRKAAKITVEHLGPEGKSVYSVCAPLTSKRAIKLNGFKPG